ncbi:hypothetical protein [Fusobacterium sp. HC1336]|uniref:hypothetical protein n=1 Tax=Fusobacterium sp. HC1336 TaxID=3171169 RepID=UPI003F21D3A2
MTITLEKAKENLFKEKKLSYSEALDSKLVLIINKDIIEVDVENISIQKIGDSYYLQYRDIEDEILIARAEGTF